MPDTNPGPDAGFESGIAAFRSLAKMKVWKPEINKTPFDQTIKK